MRRKTKRIALVAMDNLYQRMLSGCVAALDPDIWMEKCDMDAMRAMYKIVSVIGLLNGSTVMWEFWMARNMISMSCSMVSAMRVVTVYKVCILRMWHFQSLDGGGTGVDVMVEVDVGVGVDVTRADLIGS